MQGACGFSDGSLLSSKCRTDAEGSHLGNGLPRENARATPQKMLIRSWRELRNEVEFDFANGYGIAFLYTHFGELLDYAFFAQDLLEVRH